MRMTETGYRNALLADRKPIAGSVEASMVRGESGGGCSDGREQGGGPGVERGRVEQADRGVGGADQHGDFGAPEDDGLRSSGGQRAEDAPVLRPGRIEHAADAQ